MSTSAEQAVWSRVRRDGTVFIVLGTAVAAAAGYAYQFVGGRALGPEGFAPISALLTVHFLAFTVVLLPVEQFVIRMVTLRQGVERPSPGASLVATIGAVVAAALFVIATRDRFFEGSWAYVFPMVVTVAAHGLFAVGRGVMAGRRRFAAYGISSAAAAVVRLGMTILTLIWADSALGPAWALALSPLLILAWRPFSGSAAAVVRTAGAAKFLSGFVVANAAAQALLLSGPLVAGGLGASAAEVSVLFVTLQLARAPLVLGHNLTARLLPPFTRYAAEGRGDLLRRWVARLTALGVAATLPAVAVTAWIGPDVVALLFGEEFRPGTSLAAVIAGGVVLSGAALFVNQIAVARDRTGSLAVAWSIALAVALVVLIQVGGHPDMRTAVAFAAGAAAAFAGGIVAAGRN